MSEITGHQVCPVDELQIKEKKVIRIDDHGIVVYRENENQFVAFGNKCSHFGAPLINGIIYKNLSVCPWHGACFNIHNGDIEEFPGCDNIPIYETFVKDGHVFLKTSPDGKVLPKTETESTLEMTNDKCFVIVGGGPAGFQCADTLRQEGFNGRIVLVCAENAPPYDRTKLSKNLASHIENIVLRNENYYREYQIDLILNTSCTGLDVDNQLVNLDNGNNLKYDKIFIATGSSPRKLDSSMDNLTNVYYMRTYVDAQNIHKYSENKDVVLIGSSFIVIEIACAIVKTAKSVTVLSRSEVPFAKSLGKRIGSAIKNFIVSKNIKFIVTNSKLNFVNNGDVLESIKYDDQSELPLDLCIIGIGSEPNTEFLKESKIKLSQSFVEVNERFQTSVDNVYAGGDVVIYPNMIYDNRLMNISHWQTAQAHGRLASLNMLNKQPKFKSVPFFWSMLLGKGIRFAGHVEKADDCLIDGNVDELAFAAYYFDSQDNVVAVATMSRDPLASAFAALLRDNIRLTKQEIETNGSEWFEKHFL